MDIPGFLVPVIVLEVLAVLAVIWALVILITGKGQSDSDEVVVPRRHRAANGAAPAKASPGGSSTAAKSPSRVAHVTSAPRVDSTKVGQAASSVLNQPSRWPERGDQTYRSALLAAIAASVGVIIGSTGTWVAVALFSVGGLDASWWGKAALGLGVFSGIVLLIVLFGERTPLNPKWTAPASWAVFVAGVACSAYSIPFISRVLTLGTADFFGVKIGAQVGWGLWLLAVSSLVLTVTARIVARQIASITGLDVHRGESRLTTADRYQWAAMIAAAAVVITAIVYFVLNWNGNPVGVERPTPSDIPSFPSLPSASSFPTDLPTTDGN